MTHQPKVAIVILNWNGRKYLEQFLPSVTTTSYSNHEIIIVDNNSSDDSVSFLQTNYPSLQVIHLSKNYGFAKGYNEGLKQIRADYYMILNSDVEVHSDWIQPMAILLQSDGTIAACQPKVLSYTNKKRFEYAGAAGGWIDKFGYPFAKGRIFDICEEDHGQYDDVSSIFWASGAAMFIRSDIFHEVKGFDEYFFAHQEEIDFCWRLQLAGYKVYVQPFSVVYHIGGGTLPKENNLKVFLNFRNNLIMLAKNLPTGEAVWKISFRLALDTTAAWKGLLSGSGGYFIAICKAHLYFIKWILFDRSQSIFPASRKGKLDGLYHGSVVWQYFVKGKNKFSEIVFDK